MMNKSEILLILSFSTTETADSVGDYIHKLLSLQTAKLSRPVDPDYAYVHMFGLMYVYMNSSEGEK